MDYQEQAAFLGRLNESRIAISFEGFIGMAGHEGLSAALCYDHRTEERLIIETVSRLEARIRDESASGWEPEEG